jgi:branched-chain amino acid transport system substrate-binding protein
MDESRKLVDRRNVLRSLGAAGAVGLAGCAGGGGGGGGGGGSGPIKIGLQADLTGPLSTYGFWFRRVLENYVANINENGGVDGRDLELSVEDTETDSKAGAQAFRKLAQQEQVDFIIGSFSSGVCIASIPLAKQLQTPYFPSGSAPSITGADGNRWTIRTAHDITQNAAVGVRWGLENLGTKWTVMYQDYAFGQQWRDAVEQFMGDQGEILSTIPVTVGASDLTANLNKVPDDTEVLFTALILPSSTSFLKQSSDLNTPGARFGDISGIEGTKIADIQDVAQGASFITGLPPGLDSEGNNHLREIGNVSGTNRALVRQYWVAYEALSWITDGIVESGWASDSDHQAFVEWFETGPSVTAGTKYPQGDKFVRGADHQAFMNRYITRVQGNALETVTQLELSEPPAEPSANLAGQEF